MQKNFCSQISNFKALQFLCSKIEQFLLWKGGGSQGSVFQGPLIGSNSYEETGSTVFKILLKRGNLRNLDVILGVNVILEWRERKVEEEEKRAQISFRLFKIS